MSSTSDMDEMVENRKKIEKVLQQRLSELLKILTDREIRNLSNKGKIHRFDKDQVISAHGELGDSLKCVVSGSLEASSIYGQGANEISQRELTLGRGNTFGEEAILDMPCVMTVKALGPCEVCYIHVQHFRSVIGKNADVNAVLRSSLTWQEKHKSPLQILAQRKCKLLEIMSDDAIKTLSKEVEKMYIESDTLLCSQGDDGDSMFIIIKGCARATCTRSIAFQDPTTKENLTKTIELETQVYKEGDAFEDACVALGQQRIATVLALSGSCVGVLKRESMSRALISNELINSMKQFYEGSSSETFIAEALMLRSPSALFPMLDHRELRMLALGSQIQVYPENAILIQQGKTNHNIFLMLEGSAAIHVSSPSEGYQEVARVRDGQSLGEVSLILGSRATSTVTCTQQSFVVEIPYERIEGVILARPDIVDQMFQLRVSCQEKGFLLEMIGLSDSSLNDLNITNFQAVGVMASTYLEPPFLTEWEGLTVQIVEISPPIFDGSDSKRGRYQRTSDVLDQNDFRTIYRCLDTETNTFLAWNEVPLANLSCELKMRLLEEVRTCQRLTQEQPAVFQYGLAIDRLGRVALRSTWTQALPNKATGKEARGSKDILEQMESSVGLSQTELESITGISAWKALMPWESEKPVDWEDAIPEEYMSAEMLEEKRRRERTVYFSPTLIKCFSQWEDSSKNVMIFITELLAPSGGTSSARRGFTCLQLGNCTGPGGRKDAGQ